MPRCLLRGQHLPLAVAVGMSCAALASAQTILTDPWRLGCPRAIAMWWNAWERNSAVPQLIVFNMFN